MPNPSLNSDGNGTGGINLPDFRLYYKATVIKTVMALAQRQKYRSMEQNINQWNKIYLWAFFFSRKPRDKSTHIWTPYLNKGGKNIQCIKDNLFNKWCWEIWSTTCKRMKLEHFPFLFLKPWPQLSFSLMCH